MKIPAYISVPATIAVIAAGLGTGYFLYLQHQTALTTSLAAGTPLPPTSNSQITVLPGQDGLAGTEVTNSASLLPSTSSITLPPTEDISDTAPIQPAVFDPTAARLGT